MQLVFSEDDHRFEATPHTTHEADLLKRNGFVYDGVKCLWHTADVQRAEQFIHTADSDAVQKITDIKLQESSSIELSRALAPTPGFSVPSPPGLKYLDYQVAGIEYGVKNRRKFLCGDEMGLGKTVLFCGWVNYITCVQNLADPKIVIICPAKLMYHWKDHLDKWLVKPLTVGVVKNKVWPDTQVKILNYENLWYFEDELRANTWDLMGCDEAHLVKNSKAERTRFIFGWEDPTGQDPPVTPIPCERACFMTGTPIRNRPIEIYPLAHYLDPVAWPSAYEFAKEFCEGGKVLVKRGKLAGTYRNITSGAANLTELQARLRATVMLRRLKQDAIAELVKKCPKKRTIVTLPCTNNGIRSVLQEELDAWKDHEAQIKKLRVAVAAADAADDAEAYALAASKMKMQVRVSFGQMSAYRKKTALIKVQFVIAHLEEALASDPGHKVLVGFHHKDVADQIQEHFTKKGIDVSRIDGGVSPQKVIQEQNRFQSDPACQICLLSILCGTGLTLTAAHHGVLAELDWVPGNLQQWEDRMHRIGQNFPVKIEHLVIDKSLDSYLCPAIVRKLRALEEALNKNAGNSRAQRRSEMGASAATPSTATQAAPTQPSASNGAQTAPQPTSKPPSTDPIAPTVLMLLKHLANVSGFDKGDDSFGRGLAMRPYLTEAQLPYGVKMLVKYGSVLPEALVQNAKDWLFANNKRS